MTDYSNKICIITGANDGIGKETAIAMAKLNMRVIIACRSVEKATIAVEDIKKASSNNNVQFIQLDLNSLASVRRFAQEFKQLNIPLNYLINNAGIYEPPFGKTADGYESQVGVNHMGHFLLTNLLLERLEMSDNPRIVVIASHAHKRVSSINFDKLSTPEKEYNAGVVYGLSKLCNIMFTYELQRLLDEKGSKIVINCMHPGVVFTNLFQHRPLVSKFVFPIISSFLTKATESAAASSTLALGDAPHLKGVKGQYFVIAQKGESTKITYDRESWRKLWIKSAEFVGIPQEIQLNTVIVPRS